MIIANTNSGILSETGNYSKPSVTTESTMSIIVKTSAKENPLARHLTPGVILTSSELIARLKTEGLSEANARQVICRHACRNGVWRSEHLRLPRGERLFTTSGYARTTDFLKAVGAKLLDTNRWGLARCLQALGARQALHRVDVMRLLAVSPDAINGTGKVQRRLYEKELAGLEEVGALVVQRGTPLESVISPFHAGDTPVDQLAASAAAIVRRESLLARILVEQLRRQNVFSWNRVELPDPEHPYTVFNDQVFSSFGFSYLAPLVRWKDGSDQPTPSPILIDSYCGLCLLSHVHSFLQRIDRATNRGRSHLPSLGVIAARDFERDAWTHARRHGLMTISYRQMFGDEALEAMVRIQDLLDDLANSNPTDDPEDNFERFSTLLKDLKTNPVVAILRSIGFEALAGLVLRSQGYEGVELGRIVPWEDTKRDIDVFGFRGEGDELRIIECKAYHKKKSVPADEVKKFFTETVPALKKQLRVQGKHFSACKAELWTTGPLGREAREKLHILSRPRGDTWTLLKGDDVRDLLPGAVKKRATEMLDAIAINDHSDEQEE